MPPPIPTRRLFQNVDAFTGSTTPPAAASHASENGDIYINVQAGNSTNPATGSMGAKSNNNVNLFAPGILPVTHGPNYLGAGAGGTDNSQHPHYRTEMLQRVMNLTTVRTHQYAVWITVGFFRVTSQGDPSLAYTNPAAAYDRLGAEVGLPGGKKTRFRSFFIVDRTKLIGFDPSAPGSYRDAVIYRQSIQ